MQNCTAILQYLGKSKEIFCCLPTIAEPWRGDLATCRIATRFCNTWKIQGDFLLLANHYRAMDGDLATCRIATQFCNTQKNPRKDFFGSYAAMEPRQYRPKGGMSVSEGRNGGGAKACPVELAMAQNGRAIRTTVLKSTVQKITVKKMPVRSQTKPF